METTTTPILDLPNEIIISIMANLVLKDLLACRQTCHRFKQLHDESSRLQYLAELETAGMIDNPYSDISIAERLDNLRRREHAWKGLEVYLRITVPVPNTPSTVYDVTPTAYLLGVAAAPHMPFTLGIQSLRFPSQFEDEAPSYLQVQMSKQIVDFGTSIEEHDLIAIVAIAASSDNRYYLEISLLRHSTGVAHDKAEVPVITVVEIFNIPTLSIEISGENLALSVSQSDTNNTLHLFNWQKGSRKGPVHPISKLGLVFLREDLLLVPGYQDQTFTINYIPFSAPGVHDSRLTIQPLISLSLPSIGAGHRFSSIQMRCDPSPTGGGYYPKHGPPKRPYANDPQEAIMITEFGIRDLVENVTKMFIMFVRRKALVDLLPEGWEAKIAVPAPNLEPLETSGAWGSREEEEDEEEEDEEEEEVEMQTNLAIDVLDEGEAGQGAGQAHAPSSSPIRRVPWAEWGPAITRWVDGDKYNSWYITSTAGQRFVSIGKGARQDPSIIKILDFNRYHVQKMALADPKTHPSSLDRIVGVGASDDDDDDDGECPSRGAFGESLASKLPYIQLSTKRKYDYDAVLLDEQRILGIRYDASASVVKEVEALYYG